MTLPPTELTLEQLRLHILPAAGGAALVTGLFLVSGRWAGALGSAVAVVVAFAASNYTFASTDWDSYESYSMIPWKPVGEPPPAWHWLPRAAVVLVLIGLLSRWLGLIAGRLLTRPVTNYMDPDAPPERVGRYW